MAWEQEQLDLAVADIFGFHALQLGLPELDGLSSNRMQHRWVAHNAPDSRAHFLTDFSALPFSANSLDLVVLPHTLELAPDPHATLREVERVLVPEGRVVISGLNTASLWALRMRRERIYACLGLGQAFLPFVSQFIGFWRLRDWLRLLGFEVEIARFGCYRPALSSEKWLNRWSWIDQVGPRLFPVLGAVYFLVAVKRVRGMTLLSPGWRSARPLASAPVSVASSTTLTSANDEFNIKLRNPD